MKSMPCRFNTGVNEEEKTIVTSTGPFVITCEPIRELTKGSSPHMLLEHREL
jgi:hypothetical protein